MTQYVTQMKILYTSGKLLSKIFRSLVTMEKFADWADQWNVKAVYFKAIYFHTECLSISQFVFYSNADRRV